MVGGRVVKVLTMKEPPSHRRSRHAPRPHALPGEFIACLEWQRIPATACGATCSSRRRHFFNKRVSLVNYVSPETRPEEMLVDDSATAPPSASSATR